MTPFVGELVGTFILVLLGNGVVANVVLNKSKGINAGWLTIAAGWGIALFVAVYAVAASSGAHLNPASVSVWQRPANLPGRMYRAMPLHKCWARC